MICYNCENVNTCDIFHAINFSSDDFCINQCKYYDDACKYKYKRIANHDNLMRLIYDYFTDQVQGDYSEQEVKDTIINTILNL